MEGWAHRMMAGRRRRARDLGIPFRGITGEHNAITDVTGVALGYCSIMTGEAIADGSPPAVHTGVTVIFPRGKTATDPVLAGSFILNGAGECTGLHWISESGFLESPIGITNTHSVAAVHEAIIRYQQRNGLMVGKFSLPVVAETYDGFLNDINGFHVREEHVLAAIADANGGPLAEGNVGGGTGMSLFGWKGGSGTSSRRVASDSGTFTVAAFVQGNFGRANEAIIAGIPVGQLLGARPKHDASAHEEPGSIIVVVAIDAPLMPHQLNRLAKRASLGVARTGGNAGNLSGDIMLAFSTANPGFWHATGTISTCAVLSNRTLDEFFGPVADATEEAIINALVGAETMSGYQGHTLEAIPLEPLLAVLTDHGRLDVANKPRSAGR